MKPQNRRSMALSGAVRGHPKFFIAVRGPHGPTDTDSRLWSAIVHSNVRTRSAIRDYLVRAHDVSRRRTLIRPCSASPSITGPDAVTLPHQGLGARLTYRGQRSGAQSSRRKHWRPSTPPLLVSVRSAPRGMRRPWPRGVRPSCRAVAVPKRYYFRRSGHRGAHSA